MGLIAVILAGVLTGCGSTDDPSAPAGAATGPLEVTDAWIRPTPPVGNLGAFYFTITNSGAETDRLVAVTSPRCEVVELHRTDVEAGTASMNPAGPDDLVVDPGASLRFEPLSLHAMCLGLTEPVVDGETIPITLEFEIADPVSVAAAAADR
ncbi:MAG: copper chaperone PCu(A)C [Acidimicrobiales bacterium]